MVRKLSLLYKNYQEIINYIFFGILTTIVSLGTKYALLFTVLSAANPIELQLSVIISWVCAVTFAYVTNRKYVFRSKNKKVTREIGLFFSSRLVTLVLEAIILAFFINFLGMNSNFYVIFWTMISQIVITIGNYILSKIVVFKTTYINKKVCIKYTIFIAIILLLFVTCYFFPYTQDDWSWGSEIGMERLYNGFKNYNGRWLGNLLVLVMTRFRLLRALIIAAILSLFPITITKIIDIQRKNNNIMYLSIILLLFIPISIFAQTISWTAGFANYVIPILLCLVYIYFNRNLFTKKDIKIKNRWTIPLFIMGFCSTLFIEHVTIYNIFLSIFILIAVYKKQRKFIISDIFYLIGSVCGSILMFSNGAYSNIIASTDPYRSIETSNVFERIISTYFDQIYTHGIFNNFVLNILLSGILIYLVIRYINRDKKRKHRALKICLSYLIFFVTYMCFTKILGPITPVGNWLKYVEGILTLLYGISILIIIFVVIKNRKDLYKLLFEYGSIILLMAPLVLVTPVGPRCFYPSYIMMMIFTLELYRIANIHLSYINIFQMIVISGIMYYFIIFGIIYSVERQRTNLIQDGMKQQLDVIDLPKLPNEEFMWGANPENDAFESRFKLFYKIPENQKIEFID